MISSAGIGLATHCPPLVEVPQVDVEKYPTRCSMYFGQLINDIKLYI